MAVGNCDTLSLNMGVKMVVDNKDLEAELATALNAIQIAELLPQRVMA